MRSCRLPLSVALLALAFSSCTGLSPAVYKSDRRIDQVVSKTDDMRQNVGTALPALDMSPIQLKDGYYLGSISHKKSDGNLLPVRFEQGGITLVSSEPMSVRQISELITGVTGLPVSLSDDLNGQTGSLSSPGTSARPVSYSSFGSEPESGLASKMYVSYEGPLSTFLDRVSGFYNIGWNYKNGIIRLFKNATRTYSIAALPIQVKSRATMTAGSSGKSSGGDSSGSSASGTLNTSVETSLSFWSDFQSNIGAIVGSTGTYLVNQSSGTVTVTAPYDVLDSVADYVQYVNKVLLRQVVIRVEVYSLTLSSGSLFNFKPVLNWHDQNASVGFAGDSLSLTAPTPLDGKNNIGVPLTVGSLALSAGSGVVGAITNGKWVGSGGVLGLSDTDQKASLVTTASLTTMSGQPVPLQVGRSQDYVSEVDTTISDGVSSTSAKTSTVTSGISINMLPRVMDDGKILLEYAINLSDKPVFGQFEVSGSSGSRLQLLDISQKAFIQQALINNGSTLVLAGFESVSDNNRKSGVGSSGFALLGGGYDLEKKRVVTVIAITPVVLDNEETAIHMRASS